MGFFCWGYKLDHVLKYFRRRSYTVYKCFKPTIPNFVEETSLRHKKRLLFYLPFTLLKSSLIFAEWWWRQCNETQLKKAKSKLLQKKERENPQVYVKGNTTCQSLKPNPGRLRDWLDVQGEEERSSPDTNGEWFTCPCMLALINRLLSPVRKDFVFSLTSMTT